MALGDKRVANLWLADELWKLGALQFGNFTLGETAVNSPVYVNLRLLISNPVVMQRTITVMQDEVRALQRMRHPQMSHYDLIAGVPFGGLHLATAYSLYAGMPMIYLHPARNGEGTIVEGVYEGGQTVLIIDDLITGGRSLVQTAKRLLAEDLFIENALVLIDRQQGGVERLRREGIQVVSILTLEAVLHYLGSSHKISEEWYHKSMEYLLKHRSG